MYILYNWSDTQEADWFIDNIVPTNRRNQIVDLTLPWLYDYYAFVIPMPSQIQQDIMFALLIWFQFWNET